MRLGSIMVVARRQQSLLGYIPEYCDVASQTVVQCVEEGLRCGSAIMIVRKNARQDLVFMLVKETSVPSSDTMMSLH